MSLVVGLLHVASGPDPYLIGMPCACRAQPPLLRLQVVTDIDDTIKSSGGVALAGIPLGGVDISYERGSIYPGAFHFAAALSAQSILGPPAPVAVLTARAEEVRLQKHSGSSHNNWPLLITHCFALLFASHSFALPSRLSRQTKSAKAFARRAWHVGW